MPYQTFEFPNADGHMLSARWDLPADGEPVATALFAHCFTCSKNLASIGHITRALAAAGIATLRFDFTGLGESEGAFSETGLSSNVDDLVTAAEFMASEFGAPSILIGHSFGGAAVLRAAERIPTVVAVATIAAPSSADHVRKLLRGSEDEIERAGEAVVELGGRSFQIRDSFLDDLEEHRIDEAVASLGAALLILHGPLDQTVGIEHAARIFEHARHPKSFVSLDQADHLLTDAADSRYAGAVIAAWAGRYVRFSGEERADRAPTDNRIISRTGNDGFRTEIMANGHSLVADEPLAVGGSNTGPTPYNLLAAALAACTGMTLRMYADRKKWQLEGVTVRITHSKVHATDCRECEERDGKIDHLYRELEFEGDLDDSQRRRLVEIANRCPVHRTLESDVKIETALKS